MLWNLFEKSIQEPSSFITNIITGLIKYDQIIFALQIIPQGSHQIFFNSLEHEGRRKLSRISTSAEQVLWI